MTGYSINTDDDTFGTVNDFLFRKTDLRVEALLVRGSDKSHDRHLILPVEMIEHIDWPAAKLKVRGACASVRSRLDEISE